MLLLKELIGFWMMVRSHKHAVFPLVSGDSENIVLSIADRPKTTVCMQKYIQTLKEVGLAIKNVTAGGRHN